MVNFQLETVLLEDFKKRKLWRITAMEDTWTGARKMRRERLKNEKNVAAESNKESGAICTTAVDIDETAESESVNADSIKLTRKDIKRLSSARPRLRGSCPKNDYCRQYMLSEKRKLSPDDTESSTKRIKVEDDETSTQNYILKALLSVKSIQNKIELQILYESGQKLAPHEILQFLKNNLSKI